MDILCDSPRVCACCERPKQHDAFKCRAAGNTKPRHVCTECYWQATISTDMDFLEHYRSVAHVLREERVH